MSNTPPIPGAIPLAEMIQNLRDELAVTRTAGSTDPIRFQVEEVELEVAVGITREGNAGGKVSFWVVELNAGGKATSTNTHRIKLKLKPMGENKDPLLISD
jgi:hypothetical protein